MMTAQALIDHARIDTARDRSGKSWSVAGLRPTTAEVQAALPAYRDRVFCLCLGFMGNVADARDLTQDTFAKALLHFSQDNPEHVQAWLLRIARNACLDHLRRRKVRGPQHPVTETTAIDWRTPENIAGSEEEIRIIRKAIASLPPRLREVLVMREYGELSHQEIGGTLRLSSGAVAARLNRARQAVLRYYQEAHTMSEPRGRSDHDHN